MVVARDLLRSRLDPNHCQTEEDRIRIGKEKSLTEKQFLALNSPPTNEKLFEGDAEP